MSTPRAFEDQLGLLVLLMTPHWAKLFFKKEKSLLLFGRLCQKKPQYLDCSWGNMMKQSFLIKNSRKCLDLEDSKSMTLLEGLFYHDTTKYSLQTVFYRTLNLTAFPHVLHIPASSFCTNISLRQFVYCKITMQPPCNIEKSRPYNGPVKLQPFWLCNCSLPCSHLA